MRGWPSTLVKRGATRARKPDHGLRPSLSKQTPLGKQIREALVSGRNQDVVALTLSAKRERELAQHFRTVAYAGRDQETVEIFTAWLERSQERGCAGPSLRAWTTVFRVAFAQLLSSPEAIERIQRNCIALSKDAAWPDQVSLATAINRVGRLVLYDEAQAIFRAARQGYGSKLSAVVWKAAMSVQGMQGDLVGISSLFTKWRSTRSATQVPPPGPYLEFLRQLTLLDPDNAGAVAQLLHLAQVDKVPFDLLAMEIMMESHAKNRRNESVAVFYQFLLRRPDFFPSARYFTSILLVLEHLDIPPLYSHDAHLPVDTWSSLSAPVPANLDARLFHPDVIIRTLLLLQVEARSRITRSSKPVPHRILLRPTVLNKALYVYLRQNDFISCAVLLDASNVLGLRPTPATTTFLISQLYDLWVRHEINQEWDLPNGSRRSERSRWMFEREAREIAGGKARVLLRECWMQDGGIGDWETEVNKRWEELVPKTVKELAVTC